MTSVPHTSHCLRVALSCALISATLTCGKLWANVPKAPSIPPSRAEFAVPELRDPSGLLSLRMWFAYFGDHFPVNLEFLMPDTLRHNESGSVPARRRLIIPEGMMTVEQVVNVSTQTLGAAVYADASGTNLVFRTGAAGPNPFNRVLKEGIEGLFTFEEALIELRRVGNVEVHPFSRFTILNTTQPPLHVSVSKGSTVRVALNKITRAWGYHWSAAAIGCLDPSELSETGRSEPRRLVWVQFFSPPRR